MAEESVYLFFLTKLAASLTYPFHQGVGIELRA